MLFPIFEVVDVVLLPVFEVVGVFLFPIFEVVDVVLLPAARGRPLPPGDEAPGCEPRQDVHVLPGRHHQQPGLQGHHLS